MLTPDQIAAYTTAAASAFVFGGMAGYERFVNRKRAKKIEDKTDLEKQALSEALAFQRSADLMTQQAEVYRQLLEKEYAAHQVTREYHHGEAQKSQLKLSQCNELNQELRSRTDISRIEEILVTQTKAMQQMAEGIQDLLKRR